LLCEQDLAKEFIFDVPRAANPVNFVSFFWLTSIMFSVLIESSNFIVLTHLESGSFLTEMLKVVTKGGS